MKLCENVKESLKSLSCFQKDDEIDGEYHIYLGCTYHIIHLIVQRSHNQKVAFIYSLTIFSFLFFLFSLLKYLCIYMMCCIYEHTCFVLNDVSSEFVSCYISFANIMVTKLGQH